MKNVDILKIPANRIIALILLDIMSIVVAAFTALYIRFDFSFNGIPSEYLQKFERIIPYSIIITLVFLLYGNYIKVCGVMRVLQNYLILCLLLLVPLSDR